MKISHMVRRVRSLKKEGQEKKFWSILLAVVVLIVAVLVGGRILNGGLTMEQVKAQTEKFISDNMTGGKQATIKDISDAGNGVYKLSVQIQGVQQTIESYVTKDGKIFFPSAVYTDKTQNAAGQNGSQVQANAPKSTKPVVELFVMSYCPYGTQIEKGIIPAVQALGDTIDFKLKFVNYVMHQEKELDENIRQYCVNQVAPDKLLNYVSCFVNGTDSTQCLAKNGIDASAVDKCSAATDQKYNLTATYNDQSKWNGASYPPFPIYQDDNVKYGVAGSPTLVINGVQVDSGARDSASLLKTICSAFTNEPAACSANLSSVTPTPGVGTAASTNAPATSAPASNASCGN